MPQQPESYDLIVCGGGLVGASLVAALLPTLKQTGLRIALIEQSELQPVAHPEFQPSFDARSTALARGTRTAFEQMGLWTALSEHLCAIDQIQVSDRGFPSKVNMRAAQEGVDALGYVVENHWVGQVLMHAIQQAPSDQVTLLSPATVDSMKPISAGYEVSVTQDRDTKTRLIGKLVVMADGGRSELRRKMGIDYRERDYQQEALVANIEVDRPHDHLAYERFTEQGPIALLPLETVEGCHRMGLVWTLTPEESVRKQTLPEDQFLSELQQAFGSRAGRFVRAGERFSYPLKLSVADEQIRPSLVVLGNAAHALHPIAGQGFNLALRGVCALAELIIDRQIKGFDIGELKALEEFHRERLRDQQRTIQFGNGALTAFMSSNPLWRTGRNLGLRMIESIPLAKTLFARAAMGLDSPAPRLTSAGKTEQ